VNEGFDQFPQEEQAMIGKKIFPVVIIIWLVFSGYTPLSPAAGQALDTTRTPEPAQQPALSSQPELPQQPAPIFKDCTPEQQEILVKALDDARELALNAYKVLKNTPETQRDASARYHEWFGDYDPANYELVLDHFKAISDALANQAIVFTCSSPNSILAYVLPNQPYQINLCRDFWAAPRLGMDSQAGILVHEMSHFSAVAGTTDEVYSRYYARAPGKWIPVATALVNASSYQFFAENDPALLPVAVAYPSVDQQPD
jgi:hypothetical protein